MVSNGGRRPSANPVLRRRGQRKFSEATLLRMLFVMLGVIFVLYASLMIIIAKYTHSYHSPTPLRATSSSNLISDASTSQQRRDIRPLQQPVEVPPDRTTQDKKTENQNQILNLNLDIVEEKIEHFQASKKYRATPNQLDPTHIDQVDSDGNVAQLSGHQEWKDRTLKAYIEPIDQDSWNVKPLPVRTTTAKDLKIIEYPRLLSCSRLTEQWPVDDYPEEDPFLPWIHDVFPTADGTMIQFVAQNKRRCDTGTSEIDRRKIMHRQPQLSLFQHVPVKRLDDGRYRLSTHEDADMDAMETRFICRFKPSMDETFSVHNLNYDWVAYRKAHKQTFTELGKWDIKSLHTTQLIFQCPVPTHLQKQVRDGSSVVGDFATLFVDIIPIRTPPRYGPPNSFLPPRYSEFHTTNHTTEFRADDEWGNNHILPKIEDSGRWENIPICKPSLSTYEPNALARETGTGKKPHRLISCVWASAGYATRGERFAISDGHRRLREWLHYVFLVGFDHVYVYDNSGAHSNDTSLQRVTDQFPDRVTRLVWPSQVCNNNRNFADSPGERSSQYAAESSCRLRFGPHTDWIGQFDIDEYLAPMGTYNDVPQLLDKLEEEGIRIVSFGSWRAWPRRSLIEPPIAIQNRSICDNSEPCFELKVPLDKTVLQAYNCDRQRGQKKEKMPAEKQLYRPDYVKQHFVHYSTVTNLTLMNRNETAAFGQQWKWKIAADPLSRFGDEVNEGTMLHTKAIATQDTSMWLTACKDGGRGMCRIGNPYPEGAEAAGKTCDEQGWSYNCYVNEKIENYFVPLLEQSMKEANKGVLN